MPGETRFIPGHEFEGGDFGCFPQKAIGMDEIIDEINGIRKAIFQEMPFRYR